MLDNYAEVLHQLNGRPKPVKVKESLIVKACIDWLFKHGCYVWRNNTGAWKPKNSKHPIHYGKVGSGDIIGLTKTGRFITVECKSGTNDQTNPQAQFEWQIKNKNGLYILARSVDDLIAKQDEIMGIV